MAEQQGSYPFWVAMGAAFVGTLLGGGAVWFGMSQRLRSVSEDAADLRARQANLEQMQEARSEPALPVAESSPEQPTGLDRPATDPGDSPLVRAVARSRDSVVTLELGGRPAGAGVVYDPSGTLLTNYHVIEPVLRAQLALGEPGALAALGVRFVDGRERAARILAADPDEDIAVLSLVREREDEVFDAAPLGRSGELRVGEQVFSIGSPVGFESTVATGIISARERTGVLANPQLPVLQLDAAINRGNSGGPLFNLAGEIVGITTARSSRGEGIGFAIPIDHVRLFLRALEQGMRGRSGVIGVSLAPHLAIAEQLEALGYHSGVAVSEVEEGRAGALAGMQPGDVIVSLRGRRHDELDASGAGRQAFALLVGETIRGLLPGENLVVEVVRGGEVVQLDIVVEAASVDRQVRIDAERVLGLRLESEGESPVIAGFVPGAPIAKHARAQDLLVGARIVAVFGREVADLEQLGEQLAVLRRWTRTGGRRSIAIAFETQDGQLLATNAFPLVTGE